MRSSNTFTFSASVALAVSKFDVKVSNMSFKIPTISLDAGAYESTPPTLDAVCVKAPGLLRNPRTVATCSLDTIPRGAISRAPRRSAATSIIRDCLLIRDPVFMPAPDSELMAFSSAPIASSISFLVCTYEACSLLRNDVASFWDALFDEISFFSWASSALNEPSWPFLFLISTLKSSMCSLASAMSLAFLPVVFSHQQANLS
mmetsp:Transcript_25382/g.55828  ORF Transcript_25382/g.55828 Transcript_25382/m.55828 type:complete len:203 (+) Transcript_25382:399-1007(+)